MVAKKSTTTKTAAAKKKAPAKKRTMTAEEQQAAAELAKAKKAEAEAKRMMKKAEADRAKAEAERKKTEAKEKAEKSLESVAKEINVRMEKYKQGLVKADDFRLGASIFMAQAEETCKEAGIKFKDWAEANIAQSWNTVRQLLPIGRVGTEDEDKAKAMLTDMREQNKAANKKAREKAKTSKSNGKQGPTETPAMRAISALDGIKDKKEKENLIRSQAESVGLTLREENADASMSPRDALEQRFERLSQKGKISFTKWAAERLGGTFTLEGEASGDDDGGDIGDDVEAMKKMRAKNASNKKS